MPRPPLADLFVRFAATAVLVLGIGYGFRHQLTGPLIPMFRGAIWLIEPDIAIQSVDLTGSEGGERLSFRINLSSPVEYGGRTILPIGWNGGRQGGYRVSCSLDGVFLYPGLLLIAVLAWPVRTVRELVLRSAMAPPLLGVLLCVDIPTTVIAEFWNAVRLSHSIPGLTSWMIWSRFLMGGGGLVIAGVFGGLAVALAAWLDDPVRRRRAQVPEESGLARLVLRPPGSTAATGASRPPGS